MYLAGEGGFLLKTLCTETDPLTKSFLLAKAAFLVFSSSSGCNLKKKKKKIRQLSGKQIEGLN